MVLQESPQLDRLFHALADPTRRAMLRSLSADTRTIGELAAPHAMSFAAASKHVRVLETAGLVKRRIEGRAHRCSIVPGPLAAARDWLRFYEDFWNAAFDALEDALEASHEPPTQSQDRGDDQ
jgi:DNA-binding transcriptional ArsR family regulator